MQLDWGRAPHTARLLSTSASSAIGEQEASASSAAAACIGHPCDLRSGARKRLTRIAHPRIRL